MLLDAEALEPLLSTAMELKGDPPLHAVWREVRLAYNFSARFINKWDLTVLLQCREGGKNQELS